MTQSKCPICTTTKGRRTCLIKNNALVCSRCCAEMRNASQCSDCEHFSRNEIFAHKKAIQSSGYIIEKEHPEIETQIDLALAFFEKGEKTQGEKIVNQVAKDHLDLPTVQYALGILCTLENNHHEAKEHFQRAVDLYPYFTHAWYNLGRACLQTHDLISPVKCYRKVIEFGHPSDVIVKEAQRALSHQAHIIYDELRLTLDQYVEMMTLYNASFELMEKQQFQEAKEGFLKILDLSSGRHHQSWGNLGLCHAYTQNREEALAAYDKALEISPDYQVVVNNRRILLDLPDGNFSDIPYQSINYQESCTST